ncbi:MAG: hypothetical protein IJO60_05730 [Agathobacter sp.]|nr:hypothetical protein [Agathobacter sp.]
MVNITNGQLETLLLTKAMSDSVGKIERWTSLYDVVDEILVNGAVDREKYLHGVMELTQLGLLESSLESEEDIELSEAVGFDINGLTAEGIAYIEKLNDKPELKEKVAIFFDKVNEVCGAINDNDAVNLFFEKILPILLLFR